MNDKIKFLSIIIIVIIGFSMVSCGGGDNDASITVSITANDQGKISIQHAGGSVPTGTPFHSIQITTDLPAPNDSFTLTHNGVTGEYRDITITPNEEVSVTAKTSARQVIAYIFPGSENTVGFAINHWEGP